MIVSFADPVTEAVFNDRRPRRISPELFKVARRKLLMLNRALDLNDLRQPPGNKLHMLLRDRAGQHAIWINDQYRICFRWTEAGPSEVEIVDYHD